MSLLKVVHSKLLSREAARGLNLRNHRNQHFISAITDYESSLEPSTNHRSIII